ncbi:hypothetical protein BI364_05220 [Acidihalobacter yilgarnensis]|uniref:Cation efflux protein transmembrane domain-containing protein n=1 Tax=Acidihalobacter yilgarnensis TaxID=2819280 RepID=A0A1D8IT47_9GAMM|nr:CDF family Co(II)/Ni(II) efflux transporter DmeF [Acidihalobacter yilgarnensis]AOU99567.1 hypothetical protein BI364_05220 [Acidihalobacter yilgarnensis]
MHTHAETLQQLGHSHSFGLTGSQASERRTYIVIAITLITMAVELVTGYFTHSMALTADGWHMGSHAAALGIAAFAYGFSRRHAHDPRFSFGTGKVNSLAGFTSAVSLAIVALLMALESIDRLLNPVNVILNEAIWVAVLGFVVNLASALVLDDHHDHHDHHGHGHGHGHGHEHEHAEVMHHEHDAHAHSQSERHHDHNLRAAYLHVAADAITSLLAIVALLSAKYFGWIWMDPLMGIVGSILIARWSIGLLRDSGAVLLDAEDTRPLQARVRTLIEADADNRVTDLHVWRVGPKAQACILSVVTHTPRPADHYKGLLSGVPGLGHLTVEVLPCPGAACTDAIPIA